MEDIIDSLRKGLNFTEEKTRTIKANPSKLNQPINALVGSLAIRKFASVYDLEKGLKSAWDLKTPLEITQIGDNLYLFELLDKKVCDRVFNRQPWTYRGALLLLERFRGDERLEDINL